MCLSFDTPPFCILPNRQNVTIHDTYYLFSNPNFFGTAFVEYYVNPFNKEDDGR